MAIAAAWQIVDDGSEVSPVDLCRPDTHDAHFDYLLEQSMEKAFGVDLMMRALQRYRPSSIVGLRSRVWEMLQ